MRIVLLGAPGSGKGTQASRLVERYQVPHVSTGELLRAAVAARTGLGKRAKLAIEAGGLVSDDIVVGIIEQRLRESDARRGFILDGFPRNIPQAQELDRRLGLIGRPLQIALYVDVTESLLLKRLTGRLTCDECGAIYNRHLSPPKKRGVCDQCGARKLVRRADDNDKTVTARLETYAQQTRPLIDYYKAQHKLRTVPGDGNVDEISARVMEIVSTEVRPLEGKFVEPAGSRRHISARSTTIAGGAVIKTPPAPPTHSATSAGRTHGIGSTTSRHTAAGKSAESPQARKKTTIGKAVHKPAIGKKKVTAKPASARKAAPGKAGSKKTAAKKTASTKARTSPKAAGTAATAEKAPARKTVASKAKAKISPAKKKTAKEKTAKKKTAKKKTAKKKAAKKKAVKKKAVKKKTPAKQKPAPT